MNRNRKLAIGVALFGVGLALRLAYAAFSLKLRGRPPTDVFDPWDTIAATMLAGGGMKCELFGLTWWSHRPPVFPLVIAGVRYVFGTGMWPVYALNAILGGATALVVWRAGARALGERTGLWAGIAFAVWPFSIVWGAGIQPEVLGAFLLAATIWALVSGHAIAAGVLVGILGLTRSNFLFVGPLFAVWMIFAGQRRRALPLALAWAVTLTPWIARNYVVHGQFMAGSSDGGMAFLFYNDKEMLRRQLAGESERVDPMSLTYGRIFDELKTLPEPAQTKLMFRAGMDNVREAPGLYARVLPRRLWLLWDPVPDTGGRVGQLVGVPLAVAHLLALWGLVVLARDPQRRALAVLLLGVVGIGTAVILVRAVSRYKATVEPAVVLLAAAGAADVYQRVRRRVQARRPSPAVPAVSA